ncbi:MULTISPECIES: hypothetical protein [unclassified Pseudoclavibacter]|uniref:hypothetical protein n=1 Tax=unclassified Pseudoclavibacter TaxID=2615177 RepID=UPI000CE777A3|nr:MULTISPECIES: hypothetical protein [unclassified Pseudoclavibacter]MBF4551230.1 hypothetical protein [Pseudoclavibacter sp. VKM Ac-2888]PPG01548.1 hypothetical protein C5E06_16445 [Pseudoclavibacter sp. RFBI5]
MRASLPSNSSSTDKQLPSRRAIVTAGAWSIPLVTLAVGAPSASASTTTAGFDLAIVGLQFGDSLPLFTPDYSQRYTSFVPLSNFAVANFGDTPSPASGFQASYTVDNEVATIDRVGYRVAGAAEPTYVDDVETIVTGTRTEHRWLVPVSVPVNESDDPIFPTGAVVLVVESTVLLRYPNDAYDPAKITGSRVSATSLAPETKTDNNVLQGVGVTELEPAAPYAAETEASFETVPLGTGPARTSRPTSVKITSVGPSPLPASGSAVVRFDYRSTTTFSIANVRRNGTATGDFLQNVTAPERQAGSSVQELVAVFGTPLDADDFLEFDIVYDAPGAGSFDVASTAGHVGFLPADNNDRNQRTTEFAYAYGVVPA